MVKQVIKKALLLTAVLLNANSFAADDEAFDQGYAIDTNQMLNNYNSPARYDVKGSWDIYLTGSLILWQAIEQGLDLGYTISNDPAGNPAKIVHMNFDYKPGFKITLGSQLGMDDWVAHLDYTFLHRTQNSSRSRVSTDPFQFYTLHDMSSVGALVNPTKLSSKWKLDFDVLDFSITRPFYLGTLITMSPFFGLKAGWIKQTSDNTVYAASSSKYKIVEKEKSWFIGPRIGFNGNWMLDEGFRIFGNVAASLFYQDFRLSAKEYLTPFTTYIVNLPRYDKGYVNSDLEIGVGFAWGSYTWHDKLHLDFLIGYDFQLFFNQNMMNSLEEEITNLSAPSPGDLMLHGFTFSFRLDF